MADGHRRPVSAAHDALEEVRLVGEPVVNALKVAARAQRPVHGKGVNLEHPLEFVHQRQGVQRGPVALVHEREDGHLALAADFEELARLAFDALGGVNHHDHGVDRGQHAVGVLGEILMAGGVEQVDAIAVVVELEHR